MFVLLQFKFWDKYEPQNEKISYMSKISNS